MHKLAYKKATVTRVYKNNLIVEHSFGVQIVCIRHILFELCSMNKKNEERRRKSKFSHSIFSNVRKSHWTLGLFDLRIAKGFHKSCVQDAILNLPNLYLIDRTMHRWQCSCGLVCTTCRHKYLACQIAMYFIHKGSIKNKQLYTRMEMKTWSNMHYRDRSSVQGINRRDGSN